MLFRSDQAVFASTTWKDRRLSFTIKSDMAGEKLSVLIPLHHEGKSVGKILIGHQEVAWQPQRIKGTDYAWFSISSGSIYPVEVFFDQK